MRDLLLPCSIFSLAAAVALHAVMPAHAGPAGDSPAPDVPTADEADDTDEAEEDDDRAGPRSGARRGRSGRAAEGPSCRAVRLGTVRDYERRLLELHDEGKRGFMSPTAGLVCGW